MRDEIRRELERLAPPARRVDVASVGLMLADTRESPWNGHPTRFTIKTVPDLLARALARLGERLGQSG